ncbi:MAG: helix-turn-helix domain-containing protein [Candidatus Onthomonas sp.]
MAVSALLSEIRAEEAYPQLTAAFSAVLSKNTSLPLPTQPETRMILLYVRTGSGQLTGAGQSWDMAEPSAILLPCQENWTLQADSDLSAQLLIVEHPRQPELVELFYRRGERVLDVTGQARFAAAMAQLSRLSLPLDHPRNAQKMGQLLEELYRCMTEPVILPEEIPAHIQRMKQLMDTNYDQELSLDVLAARLGKSKYQLSRAFSHYYHDTPGAYLTSVRLNRASELLRSTQLPVKEVSLRVGFPNDAYFISLFKKHFGVPPRQYRMARRET